MRTLAAWNNDEGAGYAPILRSFHLMVQLYLRTLRNLPQVSAVFKGDLDAQTFESLGRALGVTCTASPCITAMARYHHALDEPPGVRHEPMRQALSVHEDLRRQVGSGPALLRV